MLSLTTLGMAGCAADQEPGTAGEEDDLTSLTARQRILTFDGVVYVKPGASQDDILAAAREQTQTAFGALLATEVAVRSREVQNVDVASFKKREVTVVDPNVASDAGKPMLEVKYSYRDEAVIPVALSRHTTLSLALLSQGSDYQVNKVVEACTKNDKEAKEDAAGGLLWYDFNPSKASCRKLIDQEQRAIDVDTAKLADKAKMVPRSRVDRIFLPTAMKLGRAATADRATYPEYDRLFGGGTDPKALTVVIVNGRLAHDRVEAVKDGGYYEWMDALGVIFEKLPEFELTKIEPNTDVSSATVDGKKYESLSFKNFIQWQVYDTGYPTGLPASGRTAIKKQIADKLDGKWVTFEKKVKVVVNDGAAKDLTLRIETIFGVEEDAAPHKRALERGDIVTYNGHSYIGYGPLDPDNFSRSSFPRSYQLFWFDSCVSYNYYEKDYFQMKEGGSKNLDIITNGLEAPEYQSGAAQGAFLLKILDGSMPSYQTLLAAAKATDSLRVVDGEIDNKYDPSRTRVKILKP